MPFAPRPVRRDVALQIAILQNEGMKRLTGQELRAQAQLWFGERTWQAPLAAALGVSPTTVWRMVTENRVSGPVDAAVRAWQDHGLPERVRR